MRNREKRKDEPGFSVNFVTTDQQRAQQILFHAGRTGKIRFSITSEPDLENLYDVYVVPVVYLVRLLNSDSHLKTPSPVIAFGPAGKLKSAFLFGCIDYLREPWQFEELFIRLNKARPPAEIRCSWGTIQMGELELTSTFGKVTLSYRESLVLKILLANRGTPVPRKTLQGFLGHGAAVESRTVDMHISKIRRKLQSLCPTEGCRIIGCARGKGYFLHPE